MRILSLGLSDKWIYLIFERITEFVSLVLTAHWDRSAKSIFFSSFFLLSAPSPHTQSIFLTLAVLIKRNRPWNLDGPLSWFIYQVCSAPEWWLCVMDTQGWVLAPHPLPSSSVSSSSSSIPHLLPSCLAVASELTSDMAFHRGATAQALAPNESRPGLQPPPLLLPRLKFLLLLTRRKVDICTCSKWVENRYFAPKSVPHIPAGSWVLLWNQKLMWDCLFVKQSF